MQQVQQTRRARATRVLATAGLMSSVVLGATFPATAGGSAPNSTGVEAGARAVTSSAAVPDVRSLTFDGAFQTFAFTVKLSQGSVLKVDTRDCCIVGDRWGVVVTKRGTQQAATKCGTGSTSTFTGPVTFGSSAAPFSGIATAIVYYCSGTNVFPAGMDVRFQYDGHMTVIQES